MVAERPGRRRDIGKNRGRCLAILTERDDVGRATAEGVMRARTF